MTRVIPTTEKVEEGENHPHECHVGFCSCGDFQNAKYHQWWWSRSSI